MSLNVLFEDDVVVLSNFSRTMNDPRYIDAGHDIQELLELGHKKFVLDLGGVRDTGSSFLGLLMTITRRIQRRGGDTVLAHLSRQTEEFLTTMQMEDFWDVFPDVKDAVKGFRNQTGPPPDEPDEPDEPSPR
jgi:anti-anti-sigma regulatory factor